jgi:uncharacterized protein YidB (DUF937 family)
VFGFARLASMRGETVMNFLDGLLGEVLKGALSGNVNQNQQQQMPDIFGRMFENTPAGGIGGILKQLQDAGLDRQIASWLGNGQNLPVTPTQIRDALGNEQVRQIAQQFGIPIDDLLRLLSQFLPGAVDQMSPNGELQEPPAR